uniref:Uncharacterized protein n=2 Tax=Pseudomonas TaxID=286 RepID=A0A2L1KFZ6_PSEAI|nr:Hypothetical protein [Pseudomonas aeruginosa]QLG05270.1 hypothetical protein [Pseudomonas aeruginosa]QNI17851.1 hypothetical protein [Pseudomonas aeruginosa]UGK55975.1 Hypothetical protein [Pseudomonas aeruginosa]
MRVRSESFMEFPLGRAQGWPAGDEKIMSRWSVQAISTF